MGLDSGCHKTEKHAAAIHPEPGVTLTLARHRAETIGDVRYNLAFDIPRTDTGAIGGRVALQFRTSDPSHPLVLDFKPGADFLSSVKTNGHGSGFKVVQDHIIVPAEELTAGHNTIEITFTAGEAALNRNPDFLYTLFVPARSHSTFPCFDQPDLKARFTLELTIPIGWQSVSNGAEVSRKDSPDRSKVCFAETKPIPTYLFAFASGQFEVETAELRGRQYRMFHRETDAAKVARNREAIFELHASSLEWLEEYTGIPYPFGKFDLVLIPSFQFSGMEHPGAVFYNASSLLLEESATEHQILNRANLIAHETAHMWFGGLVTMRWFNDVWMKEVFANFMAAKIVNPSFSTINHDLRFLVSNYPGAYAVDRTEGTHPIRQDLENLDEAGSLYGPIIYQKAPIVMRQLEAILGPEPFKKGVRDYLERFKFGNATWPDLVKELNERSDVNVSACSHAWVEETGRPMIRTELELDAQKNVGTLAFAQTDPEPERGLCWVQLMDVLVGFPDGTHRVRVDFRSNRAALPNMSGLPQPTFVLPTGGGFAYGDFILDSVSRDFLLQHLQELGDPLTRGSAWITLWEEVLGRRARPSAFMNLVLRALPREDTEQNVQLVLNYCDDAYWKFLPDDEQRSLSTQLEQAMRTGFTLSESPSLKSTYFSAFRSIVRTPDGLQFLARLWRRQEQIPGLKLGEDDEAAIALDLAVRSVPTAEAILLEQRGRFVNPDRKARFDFVMPAVSGNPNIRDAWFTRLSEVRNRRREPWVLEGLRYFHHPLRSAQSRKYVRPALELLQEIQRTGDIFFPKNWTDATLNGYNTHEAAETVRSFLAAHEDYPVRLRRIILQSADALFRAANILNSVST